MIIWKARKIYPNEDRLTLSHSEQESLISEWTPEPLVPESAGKFVARYLNIQGKIQRYVRIDGVSCLNMATTNFLDFVGNPEIENKAVACIAKYAVGTCGPRGFYGTTDVHLLLESTIARFCNSEKSIVYSYGFSTISSAIASYCKKQDIIFADEGVVLPIQMGILASRSKVYWFKHNNLEHLKTLLESVELQEKEDPKKFKNIRKFIIVEGLYQNHSDIPDLKQIIHLKYAYKARIIIDESLSIGTLGRSGRGIVEHFGVCPNDIDLRSFSFENAFASVGGACVGAEFIIDHQRLAGLAYCFSASSPTFLCRVVIDEIEMLENDNERVSKLQKLSRLFFDKIRNKLNPDMEVFGSEYSPIFHIRLSKYFHDIKRESHRRILENVCKFCLKDTILVLCPSYLEEKEHICPYPSIRITLNCSFTEDEVLRSVEAICASANKALEKLGD